MSAVALAKAELPYIRLRAKRFGETSPELEKRRRALARSPLRRLAPLRWLASLRSLAPYYHQTALSAG